ncbi:hypothetical protein SH467x_003608 [Pirellulaceae bacterium SH467]
MPVHSRQREASPSFPLNPPVYRPASNEEILKRCPYPAGFDPVSSGCFHLWIWAEVIEDHYKDPRVKPSRDDWMLYRPSEMAIESLNEYAKQSSRHRLFRGSVFVALRRVEAKFDKIWKSPKSTSCKALYFDALQSLCEKIKKTAETIANDVGLAKTSSTPPTESTSTPVEPRKGTAVKYLFKWECEEEIARVMVGKFQESETWRSKKPTAIGSVKDGEGRFNLYDPIALLTVYELYCERCKTPLEDATKKKILLELNQMAKFPTLPPRKTPTKTAKKPGNKKA